MYFFNTQKFVSKNVSNKLDDVVGRGKLEFNKSIFQNRGILN